MNSLMLYPPISYEELDKILEPVRVAMKNYENLSETEQLIVRFKVFAGLTSSKIDPSSVHFAIQLFETMKENRRLQARLDRANQYARHLPDHVDDVLYHLNNDDDGE